MKQMSLLKLRNRIHSVFALYFHYSRKSNCLYGSFAVVPDGLREFVDAFGFSYFRFADGATYVELKDNEK